MVGDHTPGTNTIARQLGIGGAWTIAPSPSATIIDRAKPGVFFFLLLVQGRTERMGLGSVVADFEIFGLSSLCPFSLSFFFFSYLHVERSRRRIHPPPPLRLDVGRCLLAAPPLHMHTRTRRNVDHANHHYATPGKIPCRERVGERKQNAQRTHTHTHYE